MCNRRELWYQRYTWKCNYALSDDPMVPSPEASDKEVTVLLYVTHFWWMIDETVKLLLSSGLCMKPERVEWFIVIAVKVFTLISVLDRFSSKGETKLSLVYLWGFSGSPLSHCWCVSSVSLWGGRVRLSLWKASQGKLLPPSKHVHNGPYPHFA